MQDSNTYQMVCARRPVRHSALVISKFAGGGLTPLCTPTYYTNNSNSIPSLPSCTVHSMVKGCPLGVCMCGCVCAHARDIMRHHEDIVRP